MKAVATKPDSAVTAPEFTIGDLRDALGNAALENIELGADALRDLAEVADGKLTPEEYRERVKARHGIPVR
jgi:Antitoxin VbhA